MNEGSGMQMSGWQLETERLAGHTHIRLPI